MCADLTTPYQLQQPLYDPVAPSSKLSVLRIDTLQLFHRYCLLKRAKDKVVFAISYALIEMSCHSSKSVEDILIKENMIDYESDSVAPGDGNPKPDTPVLHAPSRKSAESFSNRGTSHALTALRASSTFKEGTITNRLDEQQLLYVDDNNRSRRLSQTLVSAHTHVYNILIHLTLMNSLESLQGSLKFSWLKSNRVYYGRRHLRTVCSQRELYIAWNDKNSLIPGQVGIVITRCLCALTEGHPYCFASRK